MAAKKPEIRLVPLDAIEWIDTDSQIRIDISQEHVDTLAAVLTEADEHARDTAKALGGGVKFDHPLPPIVIFTDGGMGSPNYIGDGYNRFHAHRKAGREAIRCEVHIVEDPRFEAFRYALSANATHGLPRTNADKRNAVRQALACEKLQGMTLREIAKLCSVNHQTVKNIMDEDAGKKNRIQAEGGPVYLDKNSPSPTPHEADTPTERPPTIRIATPREHGEPEERQSEPARPSVPESVSGPKDKLRREVPTHLLPAWEGSQRLRQSRLNLEAEFNEWKQWIGELGMIPGTGHFVDFSIHAAAIKNAIDALKASEYHTDCPDCEATGKAQDKGKEKQCQSCMGQGYLCGTLYDRLPKRSKDKLSA
jgi:predicted transcriptional regulator